jgi:hypothetical protein
VARHLATHLADTWMTLTAAVNAMCLRDVVGQEPSTRRENTRAAMGGVVMDVRGALAFATLVTLAVMASEAQAQQWNDPAYDFQLGDVDHFSTEAEATRACKGDAVVWADQYTTFYYPKYLKQYGTTSHGTYTCFNQAKKADYWGVGASEGLEGSGREFPIESCPSCS